MWIRLSTGCLFILLFAFIAACGSTSQPEDSSSTTVAAIDSTAISVEEFEQSYVASLIRTGENDTRANRYRHLQGLVDEILLAREAVRRGMNEDSLFRSFSERQTKKALGGRFYEQSLLEKMELPGEDAIREAFSFSRQKVVVRHLFYRSRSEAEDAYARLEAGVSFLDEAQRCYDTASFDSLAGYLGPITYFSVDDAFAEAAFRTDVSEYTSPVRSRVGYHIILVEEKVVNPLLTESEFQTRRPGITSQVKLRKMRLTGDTFVRDYMEGLGVEVNARGVAALNLAVRAVENRASDQPVSVAENVEAMPFDMTELRHSLRPETVLATYEHLGQEREFTAEDYFFWLRDLPFAEARDRTTASVGRALRNEVLAEAGREMDLIEDPQVIREIATAERSYLASALRIELAASDPAEPDEELLRSAFESLGLAAQRSWHGSLWVVPTASYDDAVRIQNRVVQDGVNASSLRGFRTFDGVDFTSITPWGRHASRVPLRQPSVVVSGDGSAGLMFVRQRTADTPEFDEYRERLRQSVLPFVNEYELLNDLRERAIMQVDTVAFERMMHLKKSGSNESASQGELGTGA